MESMERYQISRFSAILPPCKSKVFYPAPTQWNPLPAPNCAILSHFRICPIGLLNQFKPIQANSSHFFSISSFCNGPQPPIRPIAPSPKEPLIKWERHLLR